MSRCLRNHALIKLVADEGTVAQRSHLASCQDCHARYQRLLQQFRAIEQTLLTTDPPAAVARHRLHAPIWWVPVAATVASVLLLSWQGNWQSPSRMTPSAPYVVSHEEMYSFLEDVVNPAFSYTADIEQPVFAPSFSFDDDSRVVFNDDWPCGEDDFFVSPECESTAFSLTLEEF